MEVVERLHDEFSLKSISTWFDQETIKLFNTKSNELFSSLLHLMRPADFADAQRAEKQQNAAERNQYVQQLGDPNDPEYADKIRQTVNALNARQPVQAGPEEIIRRRTEERRQKQELKTRPQRRQRKRR